MSILVEGKKCHICGGDKFGPGPAQRAASTGAPPCCITCGSLERHRAGRSLFEVFPIGFLCWRRALQFSPDTAVNPSWFYSFEISVYGGENNLDLQKIKRANDSYDFLSLSHVLEFVPDDEAALDEIARVLSPSGIVHLSLSNPTTRSETFHYSSATGHHGYFHLYGRDFQDRLKSKIRALFSIQIEVDDDVTGATEVVYLCVKNVEVISQIQSFIINRQGRSANRTGMRITGICR